MNEQSYLIFELGQSRYGISTAIVEELSLLPNIVPIPETPTHVVGLINLRGEILPIINLHQRLGQASLPYQLTDSIIVLQWQNQRIGILVNRVCEVEAIAPSQIQFYSEEARSPRGRSDALIGGIASLGADLVVLLDPESLVQSSSRLILSHQPVASEGLNGNGQNYPHHGSQSGAVVANQDGASLFSHLSADAQQILQTRAENLRQPVETQDASGVPVAVVELGDEYLGLSLETVHEFIDIRRVTPVPCCPSHILGNINLRGEIITLVDISHVINVPTDASKLRRKAIVVRLDQLTAGIAVDQIFDLIYLDPAQISEAPVAIHSNSDEYLQGVASYQNKMMSIINLSKVLTADALVVNEDV